MICTKRETEASKIGQPAKRSKVVHKHILISLYEEYNIGRTCTSNTTCSGSHQFLEDGGIGMITRQMFRRFRVTRALYTLTEAELSQVRHLTTYSEIMEAVRQINQRNQERKVIQSTGC